MTTQYEKISPEKLLNLHSIGFKLVPISKDGVTPAIEWTKVYENGWEPGELVDVNFPNIATCFGKSHIKDDKNRELYLNCLDIDSQEVFRRLALLIDENRKERHLINELCTKTYVTQTRKPYGRHIFWLSHELNTPIRLNDSKPGYEFEVKTDNSSGLASLPPSRHRDDQEFHYHNIGQNYIVVSDTLYDIVAKILDDCVRDKKAYHGQQYVAEDTRRLTDTEIDIVSNLIIPVYRKGFRHQLCYGISGLLYRNGIGLDSTSKIISLIGRDDEELNSRFRVMRHTYLKNQNEVSGRRELFETLKALCRDSSHASEILRKIMNVLNPQTGHAVKDEDHRKIADELLKEFNFKVMKDTREIYYYDKIGTYFPDAETVIREQLEMLYPDIKTRHVTEIIEKIRRRNPIGHSSFNSNLYVLNAKNGLLDICTNELIPHTPEFLSTIQISVTYERTAKCPQIMRFLGQVLRPCDIFPFIQLCGYCLMPTAKFERAFFFIGDGDNGKGTLLRVLEAFLGIENTSHVSLKEISNDRFGAADLSGKLANICADIELGKIEETSLFKRLVSGDIIRAQKKHMPAFDFANHAKLIFSSNFIPKSNDNSYAWFKRLVPFLCLNTFDENKDVSLLGKLTTKEELSGLLNLALIGLRQLMRDGGFTHYDDIHTVARIYSAYRQTIGRFVKERCVLDSCAHELSSKLYQAYQSFCKSIGMTPLTENSFGAYLRRTGIQKSRPMIHGIRSYVYVGIKLKQGQIA